MYSTNSLKYVHLTSKQPKKMSIFKMFTTIFLLSLTSVFSLPQSSRSFTNSVDLVPSGCEIYRDQDVVMSDDQQQQAPNQLFCQLRTIASAETLLSNLSQHQMSKIGTIRLQCSDVLFFESSLETKNDFLGAFKKLKDLQIESCKIRYVPSMIFSSLRDLKSLSLKTHNIDWSVMTMEFHENSLKGLNELQKLNLAENNIWSLPQDIFCPLYSLQNLNLSHNKLQDIAQLSFSDYGQGPHNPGKTCNTLLEVLDLSHNDYTRMPDNGLTSLRNLHTLLLQENHLNIIEDRSFVGLTSLQILNMSCNQLVALPPELFQYSRDLGQIYLQNNSLKALAPGLFEGLDRLQILDLSKNELSSAWVNKDTFSGLIRLVVLNLSSNQLTKLDNSVFKDLYSLQILSLEHNLIEFIQPETFGQMKNLHALTLSFNRINQIDAKFFSGLYVLNQLFLDGNLIKTIDEQAFENMTNLHDLSVNDNLLEEVPSGLGKLHYLKSLDLGKNSIRHIVNTSFEGLDQLFGLRLVDNLITNITRDSFMSLPNLQVLNLASNKIRYVEQGAFGLNPTLKAIRLDGNFLEDISGSFTNLPGLVWLNVSDNRLNNFDYSHLPSSLEWLDMHNNEIAELGNYYGLKQMLKIKMLDVSFNKLTEVKKIAVPDSIETLFLNNNGIEFVEAGTFLNKSNLEKVVLYENKLRKFELASFGLNTVPDNKVLPSFYISNNPFYCDCSMEFLLHTEKLTKLRQYPDIADLDAVQCELAHSKSGQSRPLVELKSEDFLCEYENHCFALCHCCDFDACDCKMQCPDRCKCYHNHAWSSNIVDCSNAGYTNVPENMPMDATEIYLDGNDIRSLDNHAFIGKKKLKVLYLNNTNLRSVQNKTFNGIGSLQVLHLEDNNIKTLKGHEFLRLQNLRKLYIDNNGLNKVTNNTFDNLVNLEVLSLDGNKIEDVKIPEEFAGQLKIQDNYFSCEDCDYLQETISRLQKLGTDLTKVYCTATKITVVDKVKSCQVKTSVEPEVSTQRLKEIKRTILPTETGLIPVLAAIIVSVIFVALLLSLVFVFRQDVRLWAHSRYGIRLTKSNLNHDKNKLYDAYVVYSRRDENLANRVLGDNLERFNNTICLHYRDVHTNCVGDSIRNATNSAKRLILIISHDFLHNEWSRTDFRCALQNAIENIGTEHRRQKIILLLTASQEAVSVDPVMDILLRTCTVVLWGEKRFWPKLRYFLPDPVNFRQTKNLQATKYDLNRSPNLRYTAAPSWCKLTPNLGGSGAVGAAVDEENCSLSTNSTVPQYEMPISSPGNRRTNQDSLESGVMDSAGFGQVPSVSRQQQGEMVNLNLNKFSTNGVEYFEGQSGHVYSTIPESARTYFV